MNTYGWVYSVADLELIPLFSKAIIRAEVMFVRLSQG